MELEENDLDSDGTTKNRRRILFWEIHHYFKKYIYKIVCVSWDRKYADILSENYIQSTFYNYFNESYLFNFYILGGGENGQNIDCTTVVQ